MIKPKSWIDIRGIWDIKQEDNILYSGPSDDLIPEIGLMLNDGAINKGKIACKIQFPEHISEGRILFGYSSQAGNYYSAGLGGHGAGYAIQEFIPHFGWIPIALAGSNKNLRAGKDYNVEIQLIGSKVSLFVDDVRILEHVLDAPIKGNQIGLFAVGKTKVVFKDYSYEKQQPDIFVVMQFSSPYDGLYKDVIKPVCEEYDLNVVRADDVFSEDGIILQDIIKSIVESEIIIAEITPANQNVFYELGYAHASKKPTILLAEKGKKLPFDIQGFRTLFYENSIAGKNDIVGNLSKYLKAILNIK